VEWALAWFCFWRVGLAVWGVRVWCWVVFGGCGLGVGGWTGKRCCVRASGGLMADWSEFWRWKGGGNVGEGGGSK